jgi:hypothetical protein
VSEQQATATWVFFMLGAARARLGMTSQAFARFALERGMMAYLFEHHDLLHYYDNEYVVDDLLAHLGPERAGGGADRDR